MVSKEISTHGSQTSSPVYFLNNPLEKVLSFKLLGLTICHDLSWESHISNLTSKANLQLGILRHAKSFLGPPELLTTDKAFVHSLMEYCSPLWAGAPASHLSRLHAAETSGFGRDTKMTHRPWILLIRLPAQQETGFFCNRLCLSVCLCPGHTDFFLFFFTI